MSALDEFLDEFQPRRIAVPICKRGDLIARHERLERELASGGEGLASPKLAELRDLESEIAASSQMFEFVGVTRRAWSDLMAKHPPAKEDARRGLDFDPNTFPQAAIAATCTDPGITPEQSEKLLDVLPQGEWDKLWGAVLTCNVEVALPPKSLLVSAAHLLNAESSPTSADTGSLAQPSSAGNGVQ